KRGGAIGAQDEAARRTVYREPGQGDRADLGHAVDRQAHMNRPVGAFLAIFARTVDRVDDPTAGLAEALLGVLAFFGQQAVVRPRDAQGVDEELVGDLIASLAE